MKVFRWTTMIVTAFFAEYALSSDWWVDSLGTGSGTSLETPMASIQSAISAATAGDKIHIHGGMDRVYTNLSYTVDKRLTLQDWEGKPVFRLTGSTDLITNRLVNVAANGVTLQNLRFEIQGNVLGASDDIVEITTEGAAAAHNVTLDGCEFVMTAFGGEYNQGSPVMQEATPAATNVVVRNCLFKDRDRDPDSGDGYRLTMISLKGDYAQIVNNVFTNTSRLLSGNLRYAKFSRNRVLNCRNRLLFRNNLSTGGMITTMFGTQLRDSEISYNIVWNNNGRRTEFLGKNREGFQDSNVRIFNNTIFNAEALVACNYYTSSTYNWRPLIYNNLLINNAYTNIYGFGAATTFLPASEIKNNLWFGGTNQLLDVASVGIQPVNCYNVSCTFVNTNDTSHPDFLRPNGNKTPEVMRGIGGNYPTYLGAIEPKFSSPATTIIIR